GGLCVALSEGKSVCDAVRFANRCSAISVTRHGAQPSIPYRRELEPQAEAAGSCDRAAVSIPSAAVAEA
ncbi:MAG: hypothetical protein K2O07_03050, partial [Alistipes sp.]|nr:hypothetical protein [Alistipes sp.]